MQSMTIWWRYTVLLMSSGNNLHAFCNMLFVCLQNDVDECCVFRVWVFLKAISISSVNFIQFAFLYLVYSCFCWWSLKVVFVVKTVFAGVSCFILCVFNGPASAKNLHPKLFCYLFTTYWSLLNRAMLNAQDFL